MSEKKRQLPPWLVGLVLAVIVFVIALVVVSALGYGDDPAVGALASLMPAGGGRGRLAQEPPPALSLPPAERWGEYRRSRGGGLATSPEPPPALRATSPEPPPALRATSPNVASLLGEETVVRSWGRKRSLALLGEDTRGRG